MSAMFAPLMGAFAPVAGKAAIGAGLAAGAAGAAGGIFGGGGLGILGSVLGGVAQGMQARAEARQREREAEQEHQRRRSNYAGAADGVREGWWRDPSDGSAASPAANAFQRVDPKSNASLPVGQRELPNTIGTQYTPPAAGPAPQAASAPRYQYNRRTGRIEYS